MTKVPTIRWARILFVPTGLALALLLIPAPANAHAVVTSTNPRDGEVVATAPKTVRVTFDEPITLATEGVQFLDATGKPVATTVTSLDNVVTYTPDAPLTDGTYIVSWRVISADTHPIAGGISFSVGAPSENAIAVPGQNAARDVGLLKAIAEAARYGGVLGFVGLLTFATYFATGARNRSPVFARRVAKIAAALGGVAVLGSVLLIPLIKLWQDGTSLSQLLSASVWSDALTTQPAAAAGVLTAGILIAWWAQRSTKPTAMAIGLAIALSSLVIVGHTRAYGPPWLLLSADLLHITTAALWFGGIIGICVLLAPTSQVRLSDAASAVGRFSTAALWLVLGLGAAAIVLWWRIANTVDGLWTSSYGKLVLAKLALVLIVVGVAAFNRFKVVPQLETYPHRALHLGTLRRTIVWEAALLVAVVAVTAVLVSQTPRTAEAAESRPSQGTLTAVVGNANATMIVTPARRGTNSLQLTIVDASGVPLSLAETPELSVALPRYDLGPFKHPLSMTGTGTYEAAVDFPLKGTWTVTLSVRLSEFENPVVTRKIVIP